MSLFIEVSGVDTLPPLVVFAHKKPGFIGTPYDHEIPLTNALARTGLGFGLYIRGLRAFVLVAQPDHSPLESAS